MGAFIVLVLVGCSINAHNNDPNAVDSSTASMVLFVTKNSPSPTPLSTATIQQIEFESDPADPDVLARFPVVYNALLYARPYPISEDELLGYYVPVGRTAHILGVSADGAWLFVRHPVGVDGWIETDRADVSAVALQQLLNSSPSIVELVPTPTLFSAPPTAAPVVSNRSNELAQPLAVVQSEAIEPPSPSPTITSEPESETVQQILPSGDVPPPVVTTFADGTADIVRMTAMQDAAIFAQPRPSTSPEERTGYFVPAGESVYAVGLAEDRYWVHVVYADAVQGWVSPGYFNITSGDLGMLPPSDYRVVREASELSESSNETERTTLWRLPSRPGYTE